MTTELATIDADYSIIPHDAAGPMGTLETASQLVKWMTANAKTPAFIANIQGKNYPKVEWWTAAGAALGLFPYEVSCTKEHRPDGYVYEAIVEVRRGSTTIGRGSAICSTDEKRWGHADEYAVRSMAITRATGKAYRIGLSFLAVMSGLEATPAEEIPPGGFNDRPTFTKQSPPMSAAKEVRGQPAPASATEGAQGGLYVTNVEEYNGNTNGKDWTKYTVTLSDGTEASTFDATLAALAQECQDQGKMVDPVIKPASNPKWKPTLEDLREVSGATVSSSQAQPAGEVIDNPVQTTIRKAESRNAGGGVVYAIETDHGRFGTMDASIGAPLILMEGRMVNLEWVADSRGMKVTRVLDLQDAPW